ncbi:helix-turn-helix domain-containing protein [Chryseobacterium phosphatilyticum]|nr:AraC family transcriptional regulator [Chryseobacterium phosphatilyticum]
MDRYIILMISILTVYFSIYYFYIHYKMMSWYLFLGIISLAFTYPFLRKKCSANTLVRSYLILAPIYNFYILLAYWNNSVAGFCWLLPIPLGAYIFFPKKEVVWFTVYTLVTIIAAIIAGNTIDFNFPHHSHKEVMITDIILFISNIAVIALLIYYKDKLKRQEFLHQLNNRIIEIKTPSETIIDTEGMEKLFERIEVSMSRDMLFKDIKFNLSKLSVVIDVNSSYISKAIRYKGYPNFNTYLNIYRIEYVKKLFTEIDFQKTTLMYVYTEAGFSNQSTFNRVFKQIEGITPSEYIHQNLKIGDAQDL